MRKHLSSLVVLNVVSATLLLDLLTKYWAVSRLEQPIILLPEWFRFALHKNTGIAFSLPVTGWLQIALSFVLLGILVYYWKTKQHSQAQELAIAAVVGGALGNLVERIAFGAVTDFISVWRFPVFNIADIAISLGVFTLIATELFRPHQKTRA